MKRKINKKMCFKKILLRKQKRTSSSERLALMVIDETNIWASQNSEMKKFFKVLETASKRCPEIIKFNF